MMETVNYAELLRPIGQMLEALRIESFALRLDAAGFVVRDKTRNRAQLTPREKAFLADLHQRHADALDKQDALRMASGVFEWHLTPSDIARLKQEGRRRRGATKEAPDSHSVSQILRVIGSMLDQKGGRMSSLSKEGQTVTVEYALPDGKKATDEYNVPALYDQWVRMYKKRTGERTAAAISA